MSEDMAQFLGVFLQEASEQMELLERDILRLEQEASPELLQGIFRAAHTLKGSSRAMGLTSMGELTHAMEDLFDELRNSRLTVSTPLIDALFAGLDALKLMMEQVASTASTDLDTTALVTRLRAIPAGQASPAPAASGKKKAPPKEKKQHSAEWKVALSPEQQNAMRDAQATGCSIYGLKISVAADSAMKGVRALMALQALEKTASLLAVSPDEDALENEQFEHCFEAVVATHQSDAALKQAIESLSELTLTQCQPWEDTDSADRSALHITLSETGYVAYREAVANNLRVFGIKIEVARDCVMKSVRALMTLQALENAGSILAVFPDEDALENEQFDLQFEVIVASQNEQILQQTMQKLNEIRMVTIVPWLEERDAQHPSSGQMVQTETKSAETVQAPQTTAATQAGAAARKNVAQPQTVRVDVTRLDNLLNLIGELVIDRTRIAQLCTQISLVAGNLPAMEHLTEAAAHVGRISDQLQDEIMKARMLPIDSVFNRFPRMIRDLAQKMNKEINFVMHGEEVMHIHQRQRVFAQNNSRLPFDLAY